MVEVRVAHVGVVGTDALHGRVPGLRVLRERLEPKRDDRLDPRVKEHGLVEAFFQAASRHVRVVA